MQSTSRRHNPISSLSFNAFNFVNLFNPRSNIGAANPGRIDTAGDGRIMQVGLRMTF
jgi:hypothetical protein